MRETEAMFIEPTTEVKCSSVIDKITKSPIILCVLKVQWIQRLEHQAQHWPDRETTSCWQWQYKSKDYLYSWVGPVEIPLCKTWRNHRFQRSQRSSSKETGGNGGYESVPLQQHMPSTGLQIAFGSEACDLSDVGTQEAEGVCASVGMGSWTKEQAVIQTGFPRSPSLFSDLFKCRTRETSAWGHYTCTSCKSLDTPDFENVFPNNQYMSFFHSVYTLF